MSDSFDVRNDYAYLPPDPRQLPLPQLYDKQRNKSHQWSTCYPAWNLQYYVCLASLKRHRENVIVETGTNHGCSAALLAQTLQETKIAGRVYTFEIDKQRAANAQTLFSELGLAHLITIYIGDSLVMLPQIIGGKPVDFAFIDSSHKTEHCIAETELLIENVIAGEGRFYFDNTACGPVDEALCHLKKKYGTSGWVDLPNVSRIPPGQAIWQPWQRTEPVPWHDSQNKEE